MSYRTPARPSPGYVAAEELKERAGAEIAARLMMEDSVQQTAPEAERAATAAMLARIAADLDVLADVLGGYPDRNPEVWRSAEWAKQLTDLGVACERLRQRARQLEEIAERSKGESP